MKRKVLIIEDKYSEVKGSFDFANSAFYGGEIEFENVIKSNDVPYTSLVSYDCIFVDLQLANKSALDGYGIIKKIKNQFNYALEKVVILTGHTKVVDKLKAEGLDPSVLSIVIKPISFEDVKKILDSKFK